MSESDFLRQEIDDWFTAMTALGSLGQYHTQLNALVSVLRPALAETRRGLLDAPGGSLGETYDQCRYADRRLVLLRRFWRWYGDRFDQRRDPATAPVLAAADEITWSCWQHAWRSAGSVAPAATPLPYLAPVTAATATLRDEVPAEIRAPADPVLRGWTRVLPIPTVALPPIVARRPWWLIVTAHEVGHHVLHDLGDPTELGRRVGVAAAAAGAGADERERWELWTAESFADVYSVTMVGSAAGWAVEELEQRAERDLVRPAGAGYPPPLVRWALLAEAAARLRLPPAPDTDPAVRAEPGDPQLRGLLDRVPAVVEALLAAPLGPTTLAGLAGQDAPAWQRRAISWLDVLLADDEPLPSRTLEGARLCLAGGVLAWRALSGAPDGVDGGARDALCHRLLTIVPACRVGGVRAAAAFDTGTIAAATRTIIDDLFAPSMEAQW